jgi:lysine 6-dehydrogenase
MKILVLGSGLMGPAAAFNAMADAEVSGVTLADLSQAQLATACQKLSRLQGGEKLAAMPLDLNDEAAASRLVGEHDAVVAALPKGAIPLGIRAAAAAAVPLVDLSWPPDSDLPELRSCVEAAGSLAILGCGVEPGLTEIMARYLAERLDRVEELHIQCGGIPEKPEPPLAYKIVFGGRQMPLRDTDARVVEDGQLKAVPRYSGVEKTYFCGVGECEAWHEGFMPWLLDLEPLRGLKSGTQKTVRWPGYAEKVTLLREMGLLSLEPVEIDGAPVIPKKLLDAVLYPRVRLEEGERDITCFRVLAAGLQDGHRQVYEIEMVDRYDDKLGFTSMARTTAFTGAIVARMAARGDIRGQGIGTPEQFVTGPLFDRLVDELAAAGIRFSLASRSVDILD